MIAIIDTNIFVNGNISTKKFDIGYITTLIDQEIRDKSALELKNLYKFKLQIKDPLPNYINTVITKTEPLNLNLSKADISFVALCLEMQESYFNNWVDETTPALMFLTEDNGILSALHELEIYAPNYFKPRIYKYRCHACFAIYEKDEIFCKLCGYNSITRVSVSYTDKVNVHLRKDFRIKEKKLKVDGKEVRSADQKEFARYKKKMGRKETNFEKLLERFK